VHLDSLKARKIATRAYQAASPHLLLAQARRVRFKGHGRMDSVEGKNNESGIRGCKDHIDWSGLVLSVQLDTRDLVQKHGLASRVNCVRLVRRKIGTEEKNRFAQLVCESVPYRKEGHHVGEGVIGLDRGPSTIAVVSERHAHLQGFLPGSRAESSGTAPPGSRD
jgi:putative transposase